MLCSCGVGASAAHSNHPLCWAQALQGITADMAGVEGDPALEEWESASQMRVLLMKVWGTTSAAKVKHTIEHISGQLEKGAHTTARCMAF